MAITDGTVFVIDPKTDAIRYKAHSLAQAQGYVDARDDHSVIAVSAVRCAPELLYQVCIMDGSTGQVVAHGPVVDLYEAPDLIGDLRIVILPVTDNRVKAGCDHGA